MEGEDEAKQGAILRACQPWGFFISGGMMITLVIGGARSGKSGFALTRASGIPGRKAYVATAQAFDEEMKERIEKHRQERSADWRTFEEPLALAGLLNEIGTEYNAIIVDCLTLWLSNQMMNSKDAMEEFEKLLPSIQSCNGQLFVVSNEVGMGIVPENAMARRFRDLAGTINRRMAEAAGSVYLVTAGIPLRIKGAERFL
jgi:adenosylcobinamide kinase/adenosylcobinamide-phosphate guanylyltransferase